MKRGFSLNFLLFQIFLDLMILGTSWSLAYYIRFESVIPDAQPGLEMFFLGLGGLLSICTIYFFAKGGLYSQNFFKTREEEITTMLTANIKSIFCLLLISYFISPLKISRLAILNYFLLSQVLWSLMRFWLAKKSFPKLLRRGGSLFP